MVGAEQVVVNGLGHAHHAAVITDLLHILGDLVAGVHGIVTTVIEEVTDVILLEDLQNALVIRVIHIGVRHLIAAGTQSRGRSVLQQLQLGGVLLTHVEQTVIQNTLDAVLRTQDPGDVGVLQGSCDHAVSTGVDDGSGTAGLTEDTGAF